MQYTSIKGINFHIFRISTGAKFYEYEQLGLQINLSKFQERNLLKLIIYDYLT